METKTEAVLVEGKLVRDGIPDKIRASGEEPLLKFLDHDSYRLALAKKLVEESYEVSDCSDSTDLVGELADVREVLFSIIRTERINLSVISFKACTIPEPADDVAFSLVDMYKMRMIYGAEGYETALSEQLSPVDSLALVYDSMNKLGHAYEIDPNRLAQKQIAKRTELGGFVLGVALLRADRHEY